MERVLEAVFRYQIAQAQHDPAEVFCLRVRTLVDGKEQVGDASDDILARLARDYPGVRKGSACGGRPGEPKRELLTGAPAVVYDIGPVRWVNDNEALVDGGYSRGGWHIREEEYRVVREGDEWTVKSVTLKRVT